MDQKYQKYIRKPLRLRNFDYASDHYCFVTICTRNREKLFGHFVVAGCIRPENFRLSTIGQIVDRHIRAMEMHHPDIKVEKFVIMPDHIHFILKLGCDGESGRMNPSTTISSVIGQFKAGVSREIGRSVWQRSFYDHIIRNQQDYQEIWQYIDNNPLQWILDRYFH